HLKAHVLVLVVLLASLLGLVVGLRSRLARLASQHFLPAPYALVAAEAFGSDRKRIDLHAFNDTFLLLCGSISSDDVASDFRRWRTVKARTSERIGIIGFPSAGACNTQARFNAPVPVVCYVSLSLGRAVRDANT